MRDYISVNEASKTIINEVIDTGSSKNWTRANQNNLELATSVEKTLAKYNIGLTDPKTGTWSPRSGGTRFHVTMTAVDTVKNKFGSFLKAFKSS